MQTVNGLDDPLDRPTYPTNALNFLKRLRHEHVSVEARRGKSASKTILEPPSKALRLQILIVGAGLGGLATAIALARRGHTVRVLEQAPYLSEIGAGIQIPPNSTRFLLAWGVDPFLAPYVVENEGVRIKRWDDGKLIGFTKTRPDHRQNYQAPYYVVHRAHFHDALHQRALELGVEVRLGQRVQEFDPDKPSVTLENGEVVTADLVVAADGVKSLARAHIPAQTDATPRPTKYAAYRAIVDTKKMSEDGGVNELLDHPAQYLWMGPQHHVMSYTINSGKSFNLVINCVDDSDPSTWSADTALKDMRKHFEGWDPTLVKILNMVDQTTKWPLMSGAVQSRWVSDSSKLLILGDAAHAMLPYMSQGAAMAVEDGAALAETLSFASCPDDVAQLLKTFEKVRALRTSQMQQASFVNGKIWHWDDGPEQRARDQAMEAEVREENLEESSNQWSDPVCADWTFGYDAEEELRKALAQDREKTAQMNGA